MWAFCVTCSEVSPKMVPIFFSSVMATERTFKHIIVSGHVLTLCRIQQGLPRQSFRSGLKLLGIKFAFFHSQNITSALNTWGCFWLPAGKKALERNLLNQHFSLPENFLTARWKCEKPPTLHTGLAYSAAMLHWKKSAVVLNRNHRGLTKPIGDSWNF